MGTYKHGESPDLSHVPEDFARAFAGFFMGEGHVTISSKPYTVRMDIGVHSDDVEVLREVQRYFGGSLCILRTRPLANWRLQGLLKTRAVLQMIQAYAMPLKARKLEDVQIALEYIEWRIAQPHLLGANGKAAVEKWRERIKAVKVRSG